KQLFHMLQVYAANGLWIATTKQLGYLNLNMGVAIDFTYQEDGILYEEQRISLFEKNYVTSQQLAQMDRMKEQMNLVLKAVLPDVCLGLHINELSVPEGKPEMYEVTLLSKRYGKEFPLYNESGGIKRLISIIIILMAAYNSPSLMVVVDEIDAGVFEYLLGEFLEIMKNGAKGQFLFTSHNLRALEVLGNNHIIFSTANPKNRYIRFTRLRKNHNLRDEYLRTVLLGGQNELVYEDRGSCELGYAFRKAGSIYGRS
ncbi:MAG: ATP-binding protein, partial [Clostridium sp.]|nr:ATP-binding protein [Clostridium sp.]